MPEFQQPIHSLYTCDLRDIPLGSHSIHFMYVEEHTNETVEFPHSHHGYEILYVMEGAISVMINNILYPVHASHFLFINKDVVHNVIYDPDVTKRYLSMIFAIDPNPKGTKNSASEETANKHILSFFKTIQNKDFIICEDKNDSQIYIAKMLKEADKKRWGWTFQLEYLYVCFVISTLENFVESVPDQDNYDPGNIALSCSKFLHANYPNPSLSVQDLADHFHVSTRHINRLFNECFGCSPTKTLTYYRLNYAKNYIQETDYSLETIAEKVGFKSASTLSRLFKEIEGMTISAYRKSLEKH